MGNRRIILELDREPQDLQAVWRLDSIARLIQQALNRASAAIDRILDDNSELCELWEGNDDWREAMADLRA